MKDPFYLTPLENYRKFFSKVKIGDLIEYSLRYTLEDVKNIAKAHNTIVEYADLETRKKYDTFIVRVVDKIIESGTDPILFDINLLDI